MVQIISGGGGAAVGVGGGASAAARNWSGVSAIDAEDGLLTHLWPLNDAAGQFVGVDVEGSSNMDRVGGNGCRFGFQGPNPLRDSSDTPARGRTCLTVRDSQLFYMRTPTGILGTTDFAIGFWMRMHATTTSDIGTFRVPFALCDSTTPVSTSLYLSPQTNGENGYEMALYMDSVERGTIFYMDDLDGQWHHWLIERDGSTVDVYMDGQLRLNLTSMPTTDYSGLRIQLGSLNTSTTDSAGPVRGTSFVEVATFSDALNDAAAYAEAIWNAKGYSFSA